MTSFRQSLIGRVERRMFRRYGIPSVIAENISKRFIGRFLPPNPVVVDCGAYNGDDTLEMLDGWPSAKVYAFEPVRALYDALNRRVQGRTNVRCYNLAIGDRSESRNMFVSSGESDASSSLLEPQDHLVDHPGTLFKHQETVEVRTFSDWASEEGLPRIDLFWLDMQGGELSALRSSRELVRTATAIHTEVSMKETYRGVSLYPELRSWLEKEGFAVCREAIPRGWDMGNVLFVRSGRLRGSR